MNNETVDVAHCMELIGCADELRKTKHASVEWLAKELADQLRALLAERIQLHAVIAELVRADREVRALRASIQLNAAWKAAFDVADGETK